MATKEQQLELGCEVSEYFTHRPGVQFVGFAGLGRHGGAILLDEKDPDGKLLRKLVIKYSLGELAGDQHSNADDDLRNEYRWLEILRGAEHIVRLVPFADCSLNLPGISNGEDTFEDSATPAGSEYHYTRAGILARGWAALQKLLAKMSITQEVQENEGEAEELLTFRRCPTFALEHIPHGTLWNFIGRLQRHEQLIPNRMLWRIWLCSKRFPISSRMFPHPRNTFGHIS
ncbi:hypothetical protein F4680DRAFT_467300 [Xylaria scruposa]|nr:hypothetical protein F4680DRAFT_467300 [Xylaria scruposa]